jgi:LysM repeat protein
MNSNGQTLLVPASDDAHTDEFTPFNMHASAVAEMSGFSYKVRKGDTISTIARRFHVSQVSLLQMNHGNRRLRVGQQFNILPGSGRPVRIAKRAHVRQAGLKSKTTKRNLKVASR